MRSFYLQFRVYAIQKWPLFWNLSSLIYSNPWSFYMRIRYMRAYFWSPYLSRSTCINIFYRQMSFCMQNLESK